MFLTYIREPQCTQPTIKCFKILIVMSIEALEMRLKEYKGPFTDGSFSVSIFPTCSDK